MTNISWTDETWNPTVGCSIVSPGCTNCYAMKMAHRQQFLNPDPQSPYWGSTKVVNSKAVWTGKLAMASEKTLLKPLYWKKPKRIFVNSMSDLFHDDVPDEWIDKVFAVMALCPQHTFQILTKRSKRMREYFEFHHEVSGDTRDDRISYQVSRLERIFNRAPIKNIGIYNWPLPSVHLGVSCEDQTRAEDRIPDLLATPAAVRFVSAEPLLGPIDFENIPYLDGTYLNALAGEVWTPGAGSADSFTTKCRKMGWVIVGGESGPGFRPMQIEWAESIQRQCENAGTAFFFKQDSGPKSGKQGRASDALWSCKQSPEGT